MVDTRTSGVPRWGMITKSRLAAVLNSSADKFWVLPTLMVPTLSEPGFAFAAAINSASVLYGESAPVAKMKSK